MHKFDDPFKKCVKCGQGIKFKLVRDYINFTTTQIYDKKAFHFLNENKDYDFICPECIRSIKINRLKIKLNG